MPKAHLITHDDVEDITFETDTGSGPKTKHEQKLEDILAGLNSASENAYIALYRQNGTGRESLTFLKKFPADKFEGMEDILEYLSTQHGGGDYRIHVRINGKLAANNLVSVEEPKKPIAEMPKGTDPALSAVLAQMEKQNQMIAGLYQQLSEKRNSDDGTEEKFLQKMLMYKQLFGGDNRNAGGIGQIHEAIGFLKDIGVSVGGIQEEKEEGFGTILEKALPLIQTAISQQPAQRPQPMANPNMQQNHQNALKLQIKMAVDSAVKAAAKGTDPAIFADMADTQLGEKAVQLATDPNIFDILQAYNPATANYRPWFSDVLEHIKALNGLPSRFSSEYDMEEPINETPLNRGADNVSTDGDA